MLLFILDPELVERAHRKRRQRFRLLEMAIALLLVGGNVYFTCQAFNAQDNADFGSSLLGSVLSGVMVGHVLSSYQRGRHE